MNLYIFARKEIKPTSAEQSNLQFSPRIALLMKNMNPSFQPIYYLEFLYT